MVIDWNRQVKECLRENRIMPIFHGSTMSYKMEHIYIVQRLIEEGYGDRMILNWMKVAGSGMIKDIDDVRLFRGLAEKKSPLKDLDFGIFITKGEIDRINSLREPVEDKAFLLAWVCYAKMMAIKRGMPRMESRYVSYLVWVSTGADTYRRNRKTRSRVGAFMKRLLSDGIVLLESSQVKYRSGTYFGKPVFKEFCAILFKAPWVDWAADDGYRIDSLDNGQVMRLAKLALRDDTTLLKADEAERKKAADNARRRKRYAESRMARPRKPEEEGKDPASVCPVCGKVFSRRPHARTDMCGECYSQHRKRAILDNAKKYYGRKIGKIEREDKETNHINL